MSINKEMKDLNYGIIGNCTSAALIHKDSSMDWLCLPKFDSASVLAKLLDEQKGGSFKVETEGDFDIEQHYIEDTAVLRTVFSSDSSSFEILDFMPRYMKVEAFYAPAMVTRMIRPLKGVARIRLVYDPKLEFASGETNHYAKDNFVVSVIRKPVFDTLYCYTNAEKHLLINGDYFDLEENLFFSLSYYEKVQQPNLSQALLDLEKTISYWEIWSAKTPRQSIYHKTILRSAITLKLLYYEKSGAVLAAATTSLPETIGEPRNWDYRFCWIRDASMVIKVISKLGHRKMVNKYIDFITGLVPEKDGDFQIMYGISGEKELTEKTLDHLAGYENSRPVRIGNAAYIQQQHDIYGILMDAIYFQVQNYGLEQEHQESLWGIVKNIVWLVEQNWEQPDKGIWEFREEDRHFTFSKLLCWVAVDKAIAIGKAMFPDKEERGWKVLRDQIATDIHAKAWNEKMQAYTQSYGSDDMDASVLLMEPYGFIQGKDPRYVATVKAVEKELVHNGLLFRYKNQDDFGMPSSSFTVCTFWFIDALFKIGEEEKSKEWFDRLLSYGNHLGLFSEDLDFESRRLLGNFPQAYSHLAIIDVALNFPD